METSILQPTADNINRAAAELTAGALVAFPTETVYGLGANALDEQAVLSIFAAKGRPADNPLIVHVADPAAAEPLCELNDMARALMAAYCPGPLTMLLPKKPVIPPVVTAGLDSVAIRLPSHPVARQLLKACGIPVAAPSANTSGKPSPTTARHVLCDLQGKLEIILDGGECQVGLESTVLDLTSPIPTVLRPGGITPEMLADVLGEVRVADSVMRPLKAGEKALSPGMRYRHYAPVGKLSMVKGDPVRVAELIRHLAAEAAQREEKVRVFVFEEHLPLYAQLDAVSIGSLAQPESVAHRLFAVLRQADADGIHVMYSEVLPAQGIGLAVMNRLNRAAAFTLLDADALEG